VPRAASRRLCAAPHSHSWSRPEPTGILVAPLLTRPPEVGVECGRAHPHAPYQAAVKATAVWTVRHGSDEIGPGIGLAELDVESLECVVVQGSPDACLSARRS